MRAFAVCQGDRQALALLRHRGDIVAEKLGFAGVSTIIATWVGVIGAGIGGWTAIDQQQKAIEAEQVQADKDYALQERQLNQDVKATYIETFKMFEIFHNHRAQNAAIFKTSRFSRFANLIMIVSVCQSWSKLSEMLLDGLVVK
jgi:hypothetical protein